MDVNNLNPSDLGIDNVSYEDIFNGEVDTILPMTLVQKGVVKAYQKICAGENDTFVPISIKKIFEHLQETPITKFIPKDGIGLDVAILVQRGWFEELEPKSGNSTQDCFVFTDYAKISLAKFGKMK